MEGSLDFLSDVKMLHKEVMRNSVLKSTQASTSLSGQSVKDVILNKCYIPLSVSIKSKTLDLESVISQELVEGTEGGKLLLCGGQGMGKTTAVEQLIWDWASGIHLQHFAFILRLCSTMFHGPEQSLQSALLSTHTHISAEHLEIILKTPHTILLVLDDIQDLLSNYPESGKLVCDLHQPAEGTVLVHSLLQGALLPGVSLLLTSREPVELESARFAHLIGFSNSQRKAFFQRFFDNKDEGERILQLCEGAVGIEELCACPGLCWTLCCVCKEQLGNQYGVPETLTELYCVITNTLLREHKISVETANQLIYGLGKLAKQCTSVIRTHSDIIKCGLQPFLGSQILSALLRVNAVTNASPDSTFSFMSLTFKDFLGAASFYLDHDDGRILETPREIQNYHFFLAGLSDPTQRKLLETSAGLFNSGRLVEFHRWIMNVAKEVLPNMDKKNHWQVLRILHHTLSPTLVRESVDLCKWRLIGYNDMQEADCAALSFVVQCLGELQRLNLYMSSLTEEQAEKLVTVFRLAQTINLDQSRVSVDVIRHVAKALKDGRATDISLAHCRLGHEAVKILCSSITHSCLHSLNLWDCCITPECSEALAEMLTTSKVCVLNLGANKLSDGGLVRLIGALGTFTCTLQNLNLDLCPLTGSCLAALSSALMSSLSELRNLVLRRMDLADDTLENLAQALQSGRCKLSTLIMNACELTELVFSALGSVLMCEASRLKVLSVGVNRLGDAAAKHILKALKHPNCQLQDLDLEMVELTDVSVDELCEDVMACSSLSSLSLKNNNLTDVSVPRLVKLVQDRPAFKLNVKYNDFSEDVFELMDPYETIRY
ncbi:NACHT, LRR and PYD domains-containing protein 12 isoform X2 [Tachysurus fulvidraco]|uniref:NACHT, LRR and PYD domains-containing protein 12 isoform X2 n=1 Tax=Tachysurus fulvidraco TaxID=1234273 RepID=UPI001FEDBA6A|nr:NACHT, LRR and PYD domains-containing protein 12 isoform X2 [Tachysurus fulvidraco]